MPSAEQFKTLISTIDRRSAEFGADPTPISLSPPVQNVLDTVFAKGA
jgi:hypothetical protein